MIPNIKWHQKGEFIYLKLLVNNAKNIDIQFNNEFIFKCTADNNDYELNVNFFDKIDENNENHSFIVNTNNISCTIKKEENKKWDYLVKDNDLYKNHIKIDWLNWTDEEKPDYDENVDSFLENLDDLSKDTYNPENLINNLNNKNDLEVTKTDLENEENTGVQSGESTPISSDEELKQ